MSHRLLSAFGLAALASAPLTATAQMEHAAPTCTAPGALPAVLSSWSAPTTVTGGKDRAHAPALVPGQAVTMALSQTPLVKYPLTPAKPGGTVSFGGLASFTVKQAGLWRVALGSGAWVDVVKGRKAEASVAHGHGPDCTGVRKMVDFQLTPGIYTLQVAASGENAITLLVTPLA